MTADTAYNASELSVLEGLDAVRKRPGMYIGSTDSKGLTHLVYEIVDNSVDEAIAGHCTEITLTFHPDGSIEVADNGRGIPVDVNKASGLSGVELVMTKLHAGGKFGGSGYKTAGGLHGVGASVVNALSARVDVTVRRDGKVHGMSFSRGATGVFDSDSPTAKFTPTKGVRVIGKYPAKQGTGTTVRFWHDKVLFLKDAVYDTEAITSRARQTAFLVPGLAITVRDARGSEITSETFKFDGGIVDLVDHISKDKPVSSLLHYKGEGTFKETVPVLDDQGHMVSQELTRTVEVNVALRWGVGYDTQIESFVNVVRTPHGGTHRKGFERGLSKAILASLAGTRGLLKPNEAQPTLEDILEGVTAVVSVSVPEPQFIGQTKDELGTKGVTRAVEQVVERGLKEWAEGRKTKGEARIILEKVVAAARVRLTQKQNKDAARRKTALEGASMPAKLVDCRANGIDRSELFIVEGDSALGSARLGRSAEYQALLPIRGKILNVQKASITDAMANKEVESIVQAIGAGMGRTFDLEQMRYGRVLIMADADVDGSHIRCLLITLFARYLRPVIESGRLYAAMPPLFKVTTKGRNSEEFFVTTKNELDRLLARLEADGKQWVTPIPRFKGLGEMDPEELWDTTLNPAKRSVRRITMQDVEAAEASLDLLMGEAIPPRREWLVEYADKVDREAIDA